MSLIKIQKEYSGERISDSKFQMCTLWSTLDPPDYLCTTAPMNKIEEVFEFSFKEDHAVEFYDMTIEGVAVYIYNLMKVE